MSYRIEKKLVHGVEVEVKVYPPSRRRTGKPRRVAARGTEQRGALHVAKEKGLKEVPQ